MPDMIPQINTKLSPEQMAATRRDADAVNAKHKLEGKKYGEQLGKDSFLKLLITQLSQQDPTQPMEDKQFIAQMAQFSSLEQMNNISQQMTAMNQRASLSEAYAMLGKKIQSFNAETGRVTEGTVSSIRRDGDSIFLMVGNTAVSPNDVSAVYPADSEQTIQRDINRATSAYTRQTENKDGGINPLIKNTVSNDTITDQVSDSAR
jgi:flagellar basal-body rod modification protein FlgD